MRYNGRDLKIGGFILSIFILFFFIFWFRQVDLSDKKLIGGCKGTRYGCCPNNKSKACINESCSSC
jgi:hypothetical protein